MRQKEAHGATVREVANIETNLTVTAAAQVHGSWFRVHSGGQCIRTLGPIDKNGFATELCRWYDHWPYGIFGENLGH